MIREYFIADVYTCIAIDKEKGYIEKTWIIDNDQTRIGHYEPNYEIDSYEVMVQKIDDQTYCSVDGTTYYKTVPTRLGEKFVSNIKPMELEKIQKRQKGMI